MVDCVVRVLRLAEIADDAKLHQSGLKRGGWRRRERQRRAVCPVIQRTAPRMSSTLGLVHYISDICQSRIRVAKWRTRGSSTWCSARAATNGQSVNVRRSKARRTWDRRTSTRPLCQ